MISSQTTLSSPWIGNSQRLSKSPSSTNNSLSGNRPPTLSVSSLSTLGDDVYQRGWDISDPISSTQPSPWIVNNQSTRLSSYKPNSGHSDVIISSSSELKGLCSGSRSEIFQENNDNNASNSILVVNNQMDNPISHGGNYDNNSRNFGGYDLQPISSLHQKFSGDLTSLSWNGYDNCISQAENSNLHSSQEISSLSTEGSTVNLNKEYTAERNCGIDISAGNINNAIVHPTNAFRHPHEYGNSINNNLYFSRAQGGSRLATFPLNDLGAVHEDDPYFSSNHDIPLSDRFIHETASSQHLMDELSFFSNRHPFVEGHQTSLNYPMHNPSRHNNRTPHLQTRQRVMSDDINYTYGTDHTILYQKTVADFKNRNTSSIGIAYDGSMSEFDANNYHRPRSLSSSAVNHKKRIDNGFRVNNSVYLSKDDSLSVFYKSNQNHLFTEDISADLSKQSRSPTAKRENILTSVVENPQCHGESRNTLLQCSNSIEYILTHVIYIVKFKRSQRRFTLSDRLIGDVKVGTHVKVEADRGEDLGIVISCVPVGEFDDMRCTNFKGMGCSDPSLADEESPSELKRIIRLATKEEISLLRNKDEEEDRLVQICRCKVLQRRLPMNVVDAEYQYDRHKLTFFFEAESRIDFRELVRDLFSIYKTRIWMQQIDKNLSSRQGDVLSKNLQMK